MNLNINELILTYEEMERIDRRPIGSYPGSMEEVAQAAVAKALWGLREFLMDRYDIPWQDYEAQLETAGIQRPGVK